MMIFIFLAPLTLLVFAFFMVVIHLAKPSFAYHWLIATAITFFAWALCMVSKIWIPSAYQITYWQPLDSYTISVIFTYDAITWSLSIALTTLLLSSLLTSLARESDAQEFRSPYPLISSLLITTTSLLALLAGNIFTLILSWTVLDLILLLIRIKSLQSDSQSISRALPFAYGFTGTLILVSSMMLNPSNGIKMNFENLEPIQNILVFTACAIRLKIFPLFSFPQLRNKPVEKKSILLDITPIAAALIPLIRLAGHGGILDLKPYYLAIAGLAAIYSALTWLTSPDELSALPHWILGTSALAFASSLGAQTDATLSWSLILLLSGAFIFFYSARNRWILPLFIISVIFLAPIPYTPAWRTVYLISNPFSFFSWLFLFSQILLLLGYIQHGFRKTYSLNSAERWLRIIYPFGLSFLPLTHLALSWWNGTLAKPTLEESLPGIFSTFLVILFYLWKPSHRIFYSNIITQGTKFLSLSWLNNLMSNIYYLTQYFFSAINAWLEGNASLLWVLIIIALLFSLFYQT